MSQVNKVSEATQAEWEWERMLQANDEQASLEQQLADADHRAQVLVYAAFTAWGVFLGVVGTLLAQAALRWMFAY